jgi:hypothetical protein
MYPAIEITLHPTTYAQLNKGIRLRLGTRFAASAGAPTCSPNGEGRPARHHRGGVPKAL